MSSPAGRPDLASILRTYLNEQLEDDRKLHLDTAAGRPVYALAGSYNALQMPPQEADHEILAHHQSRYADAIVERDIREVGNTVDALMSEHGLSGNETRVELGLGLLKVLYDLAEVQKQRVAGGIAIEAFGSNEAAHIPLTGQSPTVALEPAQTFTGRLLSELLPIFADQQRGTEWTGQTEYQNMKTYAMFTEVCGDLPVDAYTTKDHVVPFLEVLRRMPTNHGKSFKDKELSIREIIARADATDAPRIAQKTRNRHKAALGSLFEWLIHVAHELKGENPAHGVRTSNRGKKGSKSSNRIVWEGEKLRALFSGPAHTGSHPTFRSRSGPNIIKDAYYWLPLLGLYHGARLEELAQIVPADVRQVEGLWCLDINDMDLKHLKNEQSRRLVPIHPKLLSLGLLDFVNSSGGNRVFHDLKPGGKDNKVGYDFSRKFSAYRRGIKVYERWLDFHSLRHTFISKLADKSVSDITIATIAGHVGVTQTAKYTRGKKPSVATRFAAIQLAEWDEMPL